MTRLPGSGSGLCPRNWDGVDVTPREGTTVLPRLFAGAVGRLLNADESFSPTVGWGLSALPLSLGSDLRLLAFILTVEALAVRSELSDVASLRALRDRREKTVRMEEVELIAVEEDMVDASRKDVGGRDDAEELPWP
jgi:hypothetical protein